MFNVNWGTDRASNLSWSRGPSSGTSPSHTRCWWHCSWPPSPGSSPHSGPGSGLVWWEHLWWWRRLHSLLVAPRSPPRPKLWSFNKICWVDKVGTERYCQHLQYSSLLKVPIAKKWNVYIILWLDSLTENLTHEWNIWFINRWWTQPQSSVILFIQIRN